jgi:hypothetical protein
MLILQTLTRDHGPGSRAPPSVHTHDHHAHSTNAAAAVFGCRLDGLASITTGGSATKSAPLRAGRSPGSSATSSRCGGTSNGDLGLRVRPARLKSQLF